MEVEAAVLAVRWTVTVVGLDPLAVLVGIIDWIISTSSFRIASFARGTTQTVTSDESRNTTSGTRRSRTTTQQSLIDHVSNNLRLLCQGQRA